MGGGFHRHVRLVQFLSRLVVGVTRDVSVPIADLDTGGHWAIAAWSVVSTENFAVDRCIIPSCAPCPFCGYVGVRTAAATAPAYITTTTLLSLCALLHLFLYFPATIYIAPACKRLFTHHTFSCFLKTTPAAAACFFCMHTFCTHTIFTACAQLFYTFLP